MQQENTHPSSSSRISVTETTSLLKSAQRFRKLWWLETTCMLGTAFLAGFATIQPVAHLLKEPEKFPKEVTAFNFAVAGMAWLTMLLIACRVYITVPISSRIPSLAARRSTCVHTAGLGLMLAIMLGGIFGKVWVDLEQQRPSFVIKSIGLALSFIILTGLFGLSAKKLQTNLENESFSRNNSEEGRNALVYSGSRTPS